MATHAVRHTDPDTRVTSDTRIVLLSFLSNTRIPPDTRGTFCLFFTVDTRLSFHMSSLASSKLKPALAPSRKFLHCLSILSTFSLWLWRLVCRQGLRLPLLLTHFFMDGVAVFFLLVDPIDSHRTSILSTVLQSLRRASKLKPVFTRVNPIDTFSRVVPATDSSFSRRASKLKPAFTWHLSLIQSTLLLCQSESIGTNEPKFTSSSSACSQSLR